MQLLIRSSEKAGRKTFMPIWNSGDGAGIKKAKGAGIRRAEVESVLWLLSFSTVFVPSPLQPSAVWRTDLAAEARAALLTFLSTHIPRREISPLTAKM